jgi:NAD(P)-dependent dehydrogenase (short-subunit alcohol dehydrogenase family)
MRRLSNKMAIGTGASKGIGAGIATALGVAGARVAVNYSSDREGAERYWIICFEPSHGYQGFIGLARFHVDDSRTYEFAEAICGYVRRNSFS